MNSMAFEFWFDFNQIPDTSNLEWLREAAVIKNLKELIIRIETTGITDSPLLDVNISAIADASFAIGGVGAAAAAAMQAVSSVAPVAVALAAEVEIASRISAQDDVANMDFLFRFQFTEIEEQEQDMPPPKPNPLGFIYVGNDTWLPEKLHTKQRQAQWLVARCPYRPLWPGLKPRPPRRSTRRKR